MRDERLLTALIINRLPALQPLEKRMLFDAGLSADDYRTITMADIAAIVQRRLRPRAFDRDAILFMAASDYRYIQLSGVAAVLAEAAPLPLRQIFDPPFLLFVRGRLATTTDMLLAVVGTRTPSDAALQASTAIGRELAAERIGLVSGLARGVDGAVMAATAAAGGQVIAVLGSGIDYIYPRQHRALAERIIAAGGAIVSEYSPGTEPLRHHFPARNRIISALARAVLLMEAPQRSGALITAQCALEQGRDLYVHAVSIGSAGGAGSNALVDAGAPVVSSIRYLRSLWGYIGMDDGCHDDLSELAIAYNDTDYDQSRYRRAG